MQQLLRHHRHGIAISAGAVADRTSDYIAGLHINYPQRDTDGRLAIHTRLVAPFIRGAD